MDTGDYGEYGTGRTLEFYVPWWCAGVGHTGLYADQTTTVALGTYNADWGLSSAISIIFARSPYSIGGNAAISLEGDVAFNGVQMALDGYAVFDVSKANSVELRDCRLGHWRTFATGMSITDCTWWVYGQANTSISDGEYIEGAVIGMDYGAINTGVTATGDRGGYKNCTFNGTHNSEIVFGGDGILELINCTFNGVAVNNATGSLVGTIYQSQYYNLTVVGPDSVPIEDAEVVLRDQDDDIVFTTTTDANGAIVEQVVPYFVQDPNGVTNRTFTLHISKNGYLSHSKTISDAEMHVGLREKVVLSRAMGYGAFS